MINLNATLIVQLVNFLLLTFLLNRLVFRPMMRVLDERRARTEGRREEAAAVTADADKIWADYQERLRAAKADADRIRADLVREADARRQQLVDDASVEAEKTVAQVRARVRAEADEARKALRSDAEALANTIAERILGRSV